MTKHSTYLALLLSLVHLSVPVRASTEGAAHEQGETNNDDTDTDEELDGVEETGNKAPTPEETAPQPLDQPTHHASNGGAEASRAPLLVSTAAPKEDEDQDDEDEDEDASFGAEAQIDLMSRMVWRGLAFTRHPILAPSASILLYGFTAEYWSAYTLTNELNGRRLAAIVPSLSYEAIFGHVYVKPGVIYYAVSPDGLKSTLEATLEGGYRAGDFSLHGENMLDLGGYRGSYFGFVGAGYTRRIRPHLQFEASIDLGFANSTFNEAYLGEHRAALNLVKASVSARYNISDLLYALPGVELTSLLSFRDQVQQPTLLAGNCAFGIEF